MLYISTRNNMDTYTSHRALCEERTPDGGFYVPFYLPTFSQESLAYFKRKSAYDSVAEILNLFFSLRLSSFDIEETLGKPEFLCENLNQNLTIAEIWHTPDGEYDYLLKKLYYLLTGRFQLPVGWPRVAIEISLLFGLLGSLTKENRLFDISLMVDDLASVTAISFAKAMGFPVNLVICSCEENCAIWDLINKGECSTSSSPMYLEMLIYKAAGRQVVEEYIGAQEKSKVFRIDEDITKLLAEQYYPAVVSDSRAANIISGIYRSNQYLLDSGAALAYGGLQDYRSIVGVNKQTVIFSKKRPERIKE